MPAANPAVVTPPIAASSLILFQRAILLITKAETKSHVMTNATHSTRIIYTLNNQQTPPTRIGTTIARVKNSY